MKFSKSVTKALNKNKDSSWDKATNAEILVLPLVPEEGEYNKDDPLQMGTFKLLSNPTDVESCTYSFNMGYANGTQLVRFHIQWTKNLSKVLRGMNITTGPNLFNMVGHMCLGNVLTLS